MTQGLNFQNLSVLIIDDMESMRVILHSILKSLGVGRIHEASTADIGLDILRSRVVDLAISDMRMDGLQGCDFVKRIRSGQYSGIDPFLPVVMVSAYTEKERILWARDCGVTEFLAKPISPKHVYQRLQCVVENPRPFVKAKGYFGPDRRRRQIDTGIFERRRVEHNYNYHRMLMAS